MKIVLQAWRGWGAAEWMRPPVAKAPALIGQRLRPLAQPAIIRPLR
jgi:hypothetical protein